MLGTLVNAGSIVGGSLLGLLLKRGMPERCRITIMQGLGLAVAVVGAQMALKGNMLIVVSSLAAGGLSGELLSLDKRLDALGEKMSKIAANRNVGDGVAGASFSQGFVTATLVYCVGAMAVVGSIQDGLTGDASILFVKALLDGLTAIFFASSMGIGVAFSALPVLVYQGGITLLAGFFVDFLSDEVIVQMSATGGVLIMGISLLILKLCHIRIANLLPALLFSVLFALLYGKFVSV